MAAPIRVEDAGSGSGDDPARRRAFLLGGLWILLAAFFFSAMNAVAKFVPLSDGADIPALQVTFARYVFAAVVLLPFVLMRPARLRTRHPMRYLIRTLAGFGGIALMFLAVRHIPLAAATAIGFTSPIFAMIFAALFLKEVIGGRRWVAAVLGLAGALVIATPDHATISIGALIAIAAAVFMGAEVVGVKWLSQTSDHALTIIFYSNLAGAVLSFFMALPIWVWPNATQAGLLAAIGGVAVLGQLCVLKGVRLADANFLAPFFYVSLIYSALIGFIVFGEGISASITVGCTIILSSAAIMMRNRRQTPSTGSVTQPRAAATSGE